MEKQLQNFAGWILRLRTAAFKSRQAAADACTISRSGFINIESAGNPQLMQLLKLSDGMNIEIIIKNGQIEIK